MKLTIEIQALDLVRRIRNHQAERLAHKSVAGVMEFFIRAAGRARKQSVGPEDVPKSTPASTKSLPLNARFVRRPHEECRSYREL